MDYLRKYHNISTETIYNDLHGFIGNQKVHQSAYTEFYKGLTDQNKADKTNNDKEKQKFYEKAIKHYTKALELSPQLAAAYNNRGNAYIKIRELEHAIRDYNKAIELNPADANTYHNRGNAYLVKREFEHAILDYNKAIELNSPNISMIHYFRGISRLILKEWAEAESDLITAKNMGLDIIDFFHKRYESIENFEQKFKIKLPENIASMLTKSRP